MVPARELVWEIEDNMIVFLTEELSIKPVIQKLMNSISPEAQIGCDWMTISFQGKADLEKNLAKKMASWSYHSPHFIIIRDNDGGDCAALKNRLFHIASETDKPFHVRIVCQELEGWFLGDLQAVEKAYPSSKATNLIKKQKFRNPDRLNNASKLLEQLINTRGKVSIANKISIYLDVSQNKSTSFKVLVNTLTQLMA